MEDIMWLSLIILTILFLEVYRRIYRCYCYNPFNPPRFLVRIDIAGKKNPNYLDLVDRFLVDNGFYEIERHHYEMFNWEAENSKQLEEKNLFYKKRKSQFEEACNEGRIYIFCFDRSKTHNICKFYYEDLKQRYKELEKINFECTLREYNSKEQRKLMTPKLRKEIMVRDNYTCQICGKYMPDEVGLQIDHIIPINKGGKSVKSNLQVLCSKCNGSKSNKI